MSADLAVIIPFYNTGRYAEDLRNSLARQGKLRLQVIVVDDGSTDNTLNILRKWEEEDSSVCVLSQENKGQSAARNLALDHLFKEKDVPSYIAFIDSDDLIEEGSFETLFKFAQQYSLDILEYAGTVFFENGDLATRFAYYNNAYLRDIQTNSVFSGIEYLSDRIVQNNFMASPCMRLTSTELLQKTGIRFYEGIIHEDNLFTALCLMHAERVAYCSAPFYLRRIREGSTVTTEQSWKNIDGYYRCALELLREVNSNPALSPEDAKSVGKLVEMFLEAASANPALDDTASKSSFMQKYSLDEQLLFDWLVEGQAERLYMREANLRLEDKVNELQCKNECLVRAYENSASYRLGRALTAVPRRLRSFFSS